MSGEDKLQIGVCVQVGAEIGSQSGRNLSYADLSGASDLGASFNGGVIIKRCERKSRLQRRRSKAQVPTTTSVAPLMPRLGTIPGAQPMTAEDGRAADLLTSPVGVPAEASEKDITR